MQAVVFKNRFVTESLAIMDLSQDDDLWTVTVSVQNKLIKIQVQKVVAFVFLL